MLLISPLAILPACPSPDGTRDLCCAALLTVQKRHLGMWRSTWGAISDRLAQRQEVESALSSPFHLDTTSQTLRHERDTADPFYQQLTDDPPLLA